MPTLPDIKGPDRQKPLCYDPNRDLFIKFDDLITGKEQIVPIESLTHDQLKKLIVERNRVGPDYTMSTLTGKTYTRDDVIKEIIEQTDFGKMAVEAEAMHLSDLLKQIEEALLAFSKKC